jgi:hypothetical protein
VLLSGAQSRQDTRVYTLPVITTFHSISCNEIHSDDYNSFSTHVYPFTVSHVDYLLGRDVEKAKESTIWLEGISGVPFYSMAPDLTAVTWQKDHDKGAE